MKLKLKKLEKKLKINFKNKSIIIKSITHKSANQIINNEKLEFLGDRVIGLILSEKIYELYPNENEGSLDKRFANLVNRKTCALIALSMGIKDFIIFGNQMQKITNKDEKILSDTCEAIIGAVYLEKGYEFTKKFVLELWKKQIKLSDKTVLDSKTRLQEHSLKLYKKLPVYRLIEAKGPRHKPIFKISVSVNNSKEFLGVGNSKQKAEQSAATKILKHINIE